MCGCLKLVIDKEKLSGGRRNRQLSRRFYVAARWLKGWHTVFVKNVDTQCIRLLGAIVRGREL